VEPGREPTAGGKRWRSRGAVQQDRTAGRARLKAIELQKNIDDYLNFKIQEIQ
jgi:hypothetical protein